MMVSLTNKSTLIGSYEENFRQYIQQETNQKKTQYALLPPPHHLWGVAPRVVECGLIPQLLGGGIWSSSNRFIVMIIKFF